MYKAAAFSPGHITGFFEVCDYPENVLEKGSRGAGFSIVHGVSTFLTAEESSAPGTSFFFGKNITKEAFVSERTIDLFLRRTGIKKKYLFTVRHEIEVPLGAGFGSSGGGALSLAIALNSAFDSGLSEIEVAQLAHVAEVESKTGLGTVAGEAIGGIEIRVEPGAPGICEIEKIHGESAYACITLTFGPLATKKYLESQAERENINRVGSSLVARLRARPSVPLFMDLSREFAENTGLVPSDLINILSVLDRHGIQASMPMFGHGIFTLVPRKRVAETTEILTEFQNGGTLLASDIDTKGAHSIDESPYSS